MTLAGNATPLADRWHLFSVYIPSRYDSSARHVLWSMVRAEHREDATLILQADDTIWEHAYYHGYSYYNPSRSGLRHGGQRFDPFPVFQSGWLVWRDTDQAAMERRWSSAARWLGTPPAGVYNPGSGWTHHRSHCEYRRGQPIDPTRSPLRLRERGASAPGKASRHYIHLPRPKSQGPARAILLEFQGQGKKPR